MYTTEVNEYRTRRCLWVLLGCPCVCKAKVCEDVKCMCQVCTPEKVNVCNMCGDGFMYTIWVLQGYLTSTYMICVVMVLCTPCGCYLDGGDGTCCELYVLATVYHLTLEVEVKIHLCRRC